MLLVCARCSTKFSPGAPRCPQCTSTDCYPEGEEGNEMAKITAHGGPTDKRTGEGLEPSPAQAVSAAEGEQVPDGRVAEILAFVGDDASKAQAALDREQARDEPRVTLIEKLQRIIEGGAE